MRSGFLPLLHLCSVMPMMMMSLSLCQQLAEGCPRASRPDDNLDIPLGAMLKTLAVHDILKNHNL